MFDIRRRLELKTYSSQPVAWGERKYNGHRLTFINDEGRYLAYEGKIENIWATLPNSLQAHLLCLPKNTVVDGERYTDSDEASDVSHLKVANPGILHYTIFGIPWYDGKKYVQGNETTTLLLKAKLREAGFHTTEHLSVEECTLERALDEGIEGYVLKAKNYAEWYKHKPKQTIDVFVVTALQGHEGKFLNRWGTLVCAVWKNGKQYLIANVAKGKDEQWRDLPLSQLVGRVCEISHEGMQSQGKLKFSAFMRWRDDKEMENCLYEQIDAS